MVGFKWINKKSQIKLNSNLSDYIINKAVVLRSGNKDVQHPIEYYIQIICNELSQHSSIKESVFLGLCHYKFRPTPYNRGYGVMAFINDFKSRAMEKKLMEQVASVLGVELSDFLPDGRLFK